eukprot:6453342-Prymnesium_polylepis.1
MLAGSPGRCSPAHQPSSRTICAANAPVPCVPSASCHRMRRQSSGLNRVIWHAPAAAEASTLRGSSSREELAMRRMLVGWLAGALGGERADAPRDGLFVNLKRDTHTTVSYTHLTLPTICSV